MFPLKVSTEVSKEAFSLVLYESEHALTTLRSPENTQHLGGLKTMAPAVSPQSREEGGQ